MLVISWVSLESKEHTELTIEALTVSGTRGTGAAREMGLLVVDFLGIVVM